jgi:hypothetical protein
MSKKIKDTHFLQGRNRLYVVIIGLALILLFVGYLLGVASYEYKNRAKELKLKNVITTLGSDVVPSIISYGKVVSINGREIVMAFNEDKIRIKVKDDAKIHMLSGKLNGDQTPFDFNQIKVGDMLNIDVSVDHGGNFIGNSVIDFTQN